MAEAHTPSKSLVETDVKVMSQNKDDVTSGEPTIKAQSLSEKSKDKLFNFEAKLRQVQLGPSGQPSQVQVNRGVRHLNTLLYLYLEQLNVEIFTRFFLLQDIMSFDFISESHWLFNCLLRHVT